MHQKRRGNETRGTRATSKIKEGKVEEQVTFSVDIFTLRLPILLTQLENNAEYFDGSQEQENTLLHTIIGAAIPTKRPRIRRGEKSRQNTR